MSDSKIMIVGGGFAGLCAALFLVNKGLGNKVVIIEKDSECGGLLSSFNYGEMGVFDKRIHHISDTGIKEIDDQIYNFLELSKWRELSGVERNLTGNFFNGEMNLKTQYCSIQGLKNFNELLLDFLDNYRKEKTDKSSNLQDVLTSKFGLKITNIIKPILEKKFNARLSDLDPLSISLCPFNRLAIFDEKLCLDLIDTKLGSLMAFQDQRNLPLNKLSELNSYYPKEYGLLHVVNMFVKKLKDNGVDIRTSESVDKLNISHKKIESVETRSGDVFPISSLIWTIGLPGICNYLGINTSDVPFDKSIKTVLANLSLSEIHNMADVHSVFCYDELDLNIYRITNYSNYCNDILNKDLYPLTVEIFLNDETDCSEEELKMRTISSLIKMGILKSSEAVSFFRLEFLQSGFPKPSTKNVEGMHTIRERVKEKNIDNLLLSGILSEKNLFYLNDVILKTYSICNEKVAVYESI